ncbi:unnamed protein product [Camellia sinensis]
MDTLNDLLAHIKPGAFLAVLWMVLKDHNGWKHGEPLKVSRLSKEIIKVSSSYHHSYAITGVHTANLSDEELAESALVIRESFKAINENDLFKHDWRSRSKVQVLQYIFLKWTLAFLVGLLTGIIATFINLAVENIAGYKHLSVVRYIEEERYLMGFIFFTGVNFILTMVAAVLCVCFTPTAAGPSIPKIKAYLNGVDTPNMFGATTLIVKCFKVYINHDKVDTCESSQCEVSSSTDRILKVPGFTGTENSVEVNSL